MPRTGGRRAVRGLIAWPPDGCKRARSWRENEPRCGGGCEAPRKASASSTVCIGAQHLLMTVRQAPRRTGGSCRPASSAGRPPSVYERCKRTLVIAAQSFNRRDTARTLALSQPNSAAVCSCLHSVSVSYSQCLVQRHSPPQALQGPQQRRRRRQRRRRTAGAAAARRTCWRWVALDAP